MGSQLEKIGGSQGYFDGSVQSISELYDCLSTKNVETNLSSDFIDAGKLFKTIGEHIDSYGQDSTVEESIVFYMDTPKARNNRERVLAGEEVRATSANVVSIQPNALFGLGAMLFFAVAVLIWYSCMGVLDGPYEFNRFGLKYGKEC